MKGTLSTEAAKTQETLQKMQARVCEAEQAADEAHRKMDNALMAQRAAETWYIHTYVCTTQTQGAIWQLCGC